MTEDQAQKLADLIEETAIDQARKAVYDHDDDSYEYQTDRTIKTRLVALLRELS